jgi:ABC-type proline/glycine betaine transport system ATPase subunit
MDGPTLMATTRASALPQLLAALDGGASPADIATATSLVVGVAHASLSVARGILVRMGLSGSGTRPCCPRPRA